MENMNTKENAILATKNAPLAMEEKALIAKAALLENSLKKDIA
jgi:hypothetical protein